MKTWIPLLLLGLSFLTTSDKVYQQGKDALKQQNWSEALTAFEDVVQRGGDQADAALYWTAYVQSKTAHLQEARETLAQLERKFPKSSWRDDARALHAEIDAAVGRLAEPAPDADDQIKTAALLGLMRSDPAKGMAYVRKILDGDADLDLKRKALFLLGQTGEEEAGQLLEEVASGSGPLELRKQAIIFLGHFGGNDNLHQLVTLYKSSEQEDVRLAVLTGLMSAGAVDQLADLLRTETDENMLPHLIRNLGLADGMEPLKAYYKNAAKPQRAAVLRAMFTASDDSFLIEAAKSDPDPELRAAAAQSLGVAGNCDALTQLYASETETMVKEKMIHGMFVGGGCPELIRIARQDPDQQMRLKAIQTMGIAGDTFTEELKTLYQSPDHDIKEAAIQAFFIQGADTILVDLARKETDPQLKRAIIQKLSLMGSKEATALFQELLEQ